VKGYTEISPKDRRYYSKERGKKSDRYKALLRKRDEELATLDREKSSIRGNMVL